MRSRRWQSPLLKLMGWMLFLFSMNALPPLPWELPNNPAWAIGAGLYLWYSRCNYTQLWLEARENEGGTFGFNSGRPQKFEIAIQDRQIDQHKLFGTYWTGKRVLTVLGNGEAELFDKQLLLSRAIALSRTGSSPSKYSFRDPLAPLPDATCYDSGVPVWTRISLQE